MNAVFADTSFYQALLNPRDNWHESAVALSNDFRGRVLTSEFVLCELGGLMAHGCLRQVFLDLVADLNVAAEVAVVHASHEQFEAGLELFARRPDKEWSLIDCISFHIMRKHNITDALATDRHFEQAGFRVLMQR